MTLQKSSFVRLNIERIFVDEVLKLMPMIRQPARITNNIIKKLGVNMKKIEKSKEKQKKIREMAE